MSGNLKSAGISSGSWSHGWEILGSEEAFPKSVVITFGNGRKTQESRAAGGDSPAKSCACSTSLACWGLSG